MDGHRPIHIRSASVQSSCEYTDDASLGACIRSADGTTVSGSRKRVVIFTGDLDCAAYWVTMAGGLLGAVELVEGAGWQRPTIFSNTFLMTEGMVGGVKVR